MVVLRYKIPDEKTKRYVLLQKQTTQVYLDHGCLGVEVYRDAKDPKYWMEMYRFKDKKHYEEVVASINRDSRIDPVTKEFSSLFEIGEYKPEKQVYYQMI